MKAAKGKKSEMNATKGKQSEMKASKKDEVLPKSILKKRPSAALDAPGLKEERRESMKVDSARPVGQTGRADLPLFRQRFVRRFS